MHDIRIERWAHTLVHYCLYLKTGDILAIYGSPVASPLIEAVCREALHVGAQPVPILTLENYEEILLREGSEEQLIQSSPIAQVMAEKATARLSIQSASNPKALTSIDPARVARRRQSSHALSQVLRRREQAGEFRWCGTLYPTTGYAQEASMSLHEFEEFVFNVCFLNDPDPIARWKELGAQQQKYVDWLVGHDEVHVIGEGTDLRLSIKDRIFINSDGKRNFPSGEFFTGPVEKSVNGVVEFAIPATYDGRSVEGVRLVFQDGKVVEATARQGQAFLEQMLNLDEGARYLGEFAFGTNMNITHGIKNILFDEKIGGTIHMALGSSYPETGGLNHSALHWDMICDLRTNGEVWIDNTLFLKDGKILI
ncbi:aminopeptidase [Tengunoibacter tsumagoiensis]|uniref:Aminopeptidase n=1 Tax=Tengunoibacter tsumagoiensis TaxID=2014871 RepID=A0A402A0M4_9CHLR|nr:aminopeptidase [Tengunoibacter tsumagoiensis]GCE12606.1 aminopeptidase [Tengunoibacter tsumagoiensis]